MVNKFHVVSTIQCVSSEELSKWWNSYTITVCLLFLGKSCIVLPHWRKVFETCSIPSQVRISSLGLFQKLWAVLAQDFPLSATTLCVLSRRTVTCPGENWDRSSLMISMDDHFELSWFFSKSKRWRRCVRIVRMMSSSGSSRFRT